MPKTKSCPRLVLPDFEILKRQPRYPHVARVVAKTTIPNEHGFEITYEVRRGRNGRDWWVHAYGGGSRHSNTLHTTTPAKAEAWICAVNAGKVSIDTATTERRIHEDFLRLRSKK